MSIDVYGDEILDLELDDMMGKLHVAPEKRTELFRLLERAVMEAKDYSLVPLDFLCFFRDVMAFTDIDCEEFKFSCERRRVTEEDAEKDCLIVEGLMPDGIGSKRTIISTLDRDGCATVVVEEERFGEVEDPFSIWVNVFDSVPIRSSDMKFFQTIREFWRLVNRKQ